jgi:RimJ/RimL family protein N-acetyltransferase
VASLPQSTERLIIREITLDDAPGAFEIYSDPKVCEFVRPTGPVKDMEEQIEGLKGMMERRNALPEGYGVWALEERETGKLLGIVVLRPLPGHDGIIEVGWHLGQFAWGKGFATEAGAAALKKGFHELGLDRIIAVIDPKNFRSQAVARRLGLTYAGPIRAFDMDLWHYAITAEEWNAR